MKTLKNVIALIAIITMMFGLQALSYKSNAFKLSDLPCCESGSCNYYSPTQSVKCSTSSSMALRDLCETISNTCKRCVDMTISGCVCGNGGSTSCLEDNGKVYYGTYEECDISK